MEKITENDLVVPVIEYLRTHGGYAAIQQIRNHILATFPLSEEDLRMSVKRPGEHMFEQQIRNLTSHHKFEKLGIADAVDGGFRLRQNAIDLIDNSRDWLYSRLASGKRSDVISREIKSVDPGRRIVDFDEIADEGVQMSGTQLKRRRRSARLREAAIGHFSHDGIIECYCCGMSFETVYGQDFPGSCIEIHHKKPLSMYEDEDLGLTIREALKNVIPVCPNCHRVIHRHKLFSDTKLRALRKKLTGRED